MKSDVSLLLDRCSGGDAQAEAELFEYTYAELKRIARALLHSGRQPNHLQPTALIHEAFLRIPRAGEIAWTGRQHFFAISARAMRRVIIDEIRALQAEKRIPPAAMLPIDELQFAALPQSPELTLMIDQALTAFEALDPRRARVVEQKLFAGMTLEEIGTLAGRSTEATKKDWRIAKAWLAERVRNG